jgi:cytochrome c-type biogenesis protein CcsB
MQFFIDLIIDGEYWKTQKIIYIKDDVLKNMLGVSGDYASVYDFFDSKDGRYKLEEFTENAYMKSKAEQNNFDREVMKVNERLNIMLMSINGSMLKLFPDPLSKNHKWVSIEDTASFRPLTGGLAAINEDLQLKVLSYGSILQLYFQELSVATQTGNYSRADRILGYMKSIQRQTGTTDILPSEAKINMEVRYNKANFFVLLKYVYMILSVFLLIMAFMIHLREKTGRILNFVFYFLVALLGGALLYHTYGLVLRWYLTGHAPWSNGYEVLVFVPWVSIVAGFIFMRYSKIVLAATALLAFFMLLTAGFSNYDPQLTNLQPVLKSYWLIIHVAVIVISYGFFGIGFVLGLLNLFMYIFKTSKRENKLNQIIRDLTNINEITLLIGIVMATIGTFLGAVWANESWGRYWGWDAKETWALIILMVYAAVLHLRLIPRMSKAILFNSASVVAFGTVIMTFFGVNYYLSKGLHSYASGSGGIFPLWAWIAIIAVFLLIFAAYNKQKKFSEPTEKEEKID